jgi:hypothetical protein
LMTSFIRFSSSYTPTLPLCYQLLVLPSTGPVRRGTAR